MAQCLSFLQARFLSWQGRQSCSYPTHVVMVTWRRLKKGNVDGQRTFLSSIPDSWYNQITVNTPAQSQFSIDALVLQDQIFLMARIGLWIFKEIYKGCCWISKAVIHHIFLLLHVFFISFCLPWLSKCMFYNMQHAPTSLPLSIASHTFLTTQMDAAPSAKLSKRPRRHTNAHVTGVYWK